MRIFGNHFTTYGMKQTQETHQFKTIYSKDEEVYRILDLTDPSIVGVTEMFFSDIEKEYRAEATKEIQSKKRLGAKVVGYGIFIYPDEDNMKAQPENSVYMRDVFKQMADFFKREVIENSPRVFEDYFVPSKPSSSRKKPDAAAPDPKQADDDVPKTEINLDEVKLKQQEQKAQETGRIIGIILLGLCVGTIIICLAINVSYLFCIALVALAFLPELFHKR